jgi:hypothetical protein
MSTAMRLIVTLSLMPFMSGIDSSACAVPHVATASEITDGADTILLVKVANEKIERVSPITMDVLEVLKGDFKRKTAAVEGETARYHGPNDHPAPYDFVRPGGRFGNCFAEDYKAGGQFLLFLRNGEVHWSPLAATNEEVSGSKDPWVVWVKKHLTETPKV